MRISEIKEILKAEVVAGQEHLDRKVVAGVASDLMSDLLRGPTEDAVLLTGLNNAQVVKTAVVAGIGGVVLVRGKRPAWDMLRYAEEHQLPLLTTPFTMFSACGRLSKRGLRGVENKSGGTERMKEGGFL